MTDNKDSDFWNALTRTRRIRSPVLGWTLMVLGVFVGLTVFWAFWRTAWDTWNTGMLQAMAVVDLFVLALFAAVPFVLVGGRFLKKEARDALRNKQGGIRPFVLYLRAFRTDRGWHGWIGETNLAIALERVGVLVWRVENVGF